MGTLEKVDKFNFHLAGAFCSRPILKSRLEAGRSKQRAISQAHLERAATSTSGATWTWTVNALGRQ